MPEPFMFGQPGRHRNAGDKPARLRAWTIGGLMDRFFETMAAFGVEPAGVPR